MCQQVSRLRKNSSRPSNFCLHVTYPTGDLVKQLLNVLPPCTLVILLKILILFLNPIPILIIALLYSFNVRIHKKYKPTGSKRRASHRSKMSRFWTPLAYTLCLCASFLFASNVNICSLTIYT